MGNEDHEHLILKNVWTTTLNTDNEKVIGLYT